MPNAVPRVFISYSHDSDTHRERVLELSDRLREDGVDAEIDQYEQSPPEGWPRWMARQVKAADFVLVVATETYARRFADEETRGKGKGAKWEGAIITQALYEAEAYNTKFVPVVMARRDLKFVPELLQWATHYVLDGEAGYLDLYRRLTNQPGVTRPNLGKLVPLPSRPAAAEPRRARTPTGGRHSQTRPATVASQAKAEGRPGKRSSKSAKDELVIIRVEDGSFIVVPSERIDRTELLSLHVRAEEPGDTAFLSGLRQAGGRQLSVAYDLHAAAGRLRGVRSTREGGKEVWVLDVQEEPAAPNAFTEISFNGMSADQVAEARARQLLLGGEVPDRTGIFGGVMGWAGRQSSTKPLWPDVLRRFGHDRRRLVAVARPAFVLELWAAGIVDHVHRLDLKIKGEHLLVDFAGQRPRFYSNVGPTLISVKGQRQL